MISVILAQKILSLFLILLLGYALVRLKVLKAQDSRILSLLTLYGLMPCAILMAFQVDFTSEVRTGLLLSVAGAVLAYVVFFLLGSALKHLLKLDAVEYTSILYSNASALILPIVSAVLGSEWIVYTSGMVAVQLVLLWSHAKSRLCGEKGIDLKRILTNVNLITIVIGMVMLFCGIRLPAVVQDSVESVGGMVGPVAMLVTGMLIGGTDLKKVVTYRRVWLITLLRLVALPLVLVVILRLSGLAKLVPGGETILLITLLANATPTASTITQMAQIYEKDAAYAGAINVVTTVCCIVTMPVMVMLYQM